MRAAALDRTLIGMSPATINHAELAGIAKPLNALGKALLKELRAPGGFGRKKLTKA
jgi:hypothetical protein